MVVCCASGAVGGKYVGIAEVVCDDVVYRARGDNVCRDLSSFARVRVWFMEERAQVERMSL